MLKEWLKQQVDPPPRWAVIIDAIEYLGDKQLGRELRERSIEYYNRRTMHAEGWSQSFEQLC